ncbi:helix-turn-helix transcriptional regulator [Marinifilum fragile]|uniref:helix-turn-helix transcriptional regulator n=1 Tax=Marinifilum fragile TaxID=570161 RepID=UPI0009F8CD81
MKMETGKLIKELRVKKGLTQEDLAERTELSARTIQRIENGEVDPRLIHFK